jgi:preprotein translocase subunit SecE
MVMADPESTAVMDENTIDSAPDKVFSGQGGHIPPMRTGPGDGSPAGGAFTPYKPEQGGWTRKGTFAGCLCLVLWGGYFLWDRLSVLQGDEFWRLAVRAGIPLVFIAVLGAISWWLAFGHARSGDFMIATEGEMKKVSWSSRSEVIGSTKVVIALVVMLALLLFGVDLLFQWVFSSIGVLKK